MIKYDDVGVGVGGRFVDGFEELLSHELHFLVLAAGVGTLLRVHGLGCFKRVN